MSNYVKSRLKLKEANQSHTVLINFDSINIKAISATLFCSSRSKVQSPNPNGNRADGHEAQHTTLQLIDTYIRKIESER